MTDTSKSKSRRVMEYLATIPARQHFTSGDVRKATGLPANISASVANRLRRHDFLEVDPPAEDDRRHYRYRFPTKAVQKEYQRWLKRQTYRGEPRSYTHSKPQRPATRRRMYTTPGRGRVNVTATIREGQADMMTRILGAVGATNITVTRWVKEDDK